MHPMADWASGRLPVCRIDPDDFPLLGDRSARRAQDELYSRAGSKGTGEPEQQPISAQISDPPAEGGAWPASDLTRDDEVYWQPDPGSVLLSSGEEQVTERLTMVRGKVREGHAVEDATSSCCGPLMPDHPRLCLDGPARCPDAEIKGCPASLAFRQLHTGPPFAQVAGPADPGRSTPPRPDVSDRKHNRVPEGLLRHRQLGHDTPSMVRQCTLSSLNLPTSFGRIESPTHQPRPRVSPYPWGEVRLFAGSFSADRTGRVVVAE